MKNSFVSKLIFFFLLVQYCGHTKALSQKEAFVEISGSVVNLNNSITVEDKSEFNDLSLPQATRIFIPDSNSFFKIKFSLAQANYFRIGRNILYLHPGDIIKTKIDFNSPEKSTFKGSHYVENSYLKNTPYPKMSSFLDGEDGIKNSIEETINSIIWKSQRRTSQLKKIRSKVDKEFFRLENVRIKSDVINSFLGILIYYPFVHKTPKDSLPQLRNDIQSQIEKYLKYYSIGLLKSEFLKIEVYRNVVQTIIAKQTQPVEIPCKIQEWKIGKDIKRRALALENKAEIKNLVNNVSALKTVEYRDALFETIDNLTKLNNGDVARDIEFVNYKNEKVKLSDYRGKVIYLDLWATWCGPCIESKPHFDELLERFKRNPDVFFLSLSIDNDKNKWLSYISKISEFKNEFIIDRNLLTDYNVTSIPRIIIIDKNFKIASSNATSLGIESAYSIINNLSLIGK